MLTRDDSDLQDALAPLREARPAIDAGATVARAAAARRRRRSRRLVAAAATATAAAAVGLAALPGRDDAGESPTAQGLLRSAAAVAADQPEPPAWAGYRYVKELERWTGRRFAEPKDGQLPERLEPIGKPWTVEKTVELWVDRRWEGRRVSGAAKVVAGERRGGASELMRPYDGPLGYDESPLKNVPLDELPTDAKRLRELLVAAYKDLRWSPPGKWAKGYPTPAQVHYDVLKLVVDLLGHANVTAEQRAALIRVLGEYEGVRPLPSVRDHLGREGRGVDIPVTRPFADDHGTIRVIFSRDTSELLEWSEDPWRGTRANRPGEARTFVRTGHVSAIGERPGA